MKALPEIRETDEVIAGLRIAIRSTTSSFSDYPEWNPEDPHQYYTVVSDGACS